MVEKSFKLSNLLLLLFLIAILLFLVIHPQNCPTSAEPGVINSLFRLFCG
jgi:hypothetical protein